MVTHHWANLFVDLLAAIVADALGVFFYGPIAERLRDPQAASALKEEIVAAERGVDFLDVATVLHTSDIDGIHFH